MRRRTLLWGSAAIAGTGLAGAALWKPGDLGGPHNQYFAGMNEILKSQGPGRPVMVLDLDRANSNIDTLTAGFSHREPIELWPSHYHRCPFYNTSCSAQVPAR